MDTLNFQVEIEKICREISDITKEQPMAFATSVKDIVSVRNVTAVVHGHRIYFQTDERMEKVSQIKENDNVGLCVENYQIRGVAKIMGPWGRNKEIIMEYKKNHEAAYAKYSAVKTEVVVGVDILWIKKWEFIDGLSYILFLDNQNKSAKREKVDF